MDLKKMIKPMTPVMSKIVVSIKIFLKDSKTG